MADADIFIERVEARLAELKIKPAEFSRRVTGGPDFFRDIKRKGHLPSSENLARTSEVLDRSADWLLGSDQGGIVSDVSVRDLRPGWRGAEPSLPRIPLVGTGDCADLSVKDEETGREISVERASFDPEFHVRYISRPAALAQARDLYAIYFHGSSMEPRFYAGETGIVDPRRPPSPGDYVLVQLSDGTTDEVTSAMAKRLVRQNSREIVLEQHNPAVMFSVPRGQVVRVHRIIPPSELFG